MISIMIDVTAIKDWNYKSGSRTTMRVEIPQDVAIDFSSIINSLVAGAIKNIDAPEVEE